MVAQSLHPYTLDHATPPPPNFELRKVVREVAGSMRYSLYGVLATLNEPADFEVDSIEATFRSFLKTLSTRSEQRLDEAAAHAADVLGSKAAARQTIFGAAGTTELEAHLARGFAASLADFTVNPRLVGLKPGSVVIPEHAMSLDRSGQPQVDWARVRLLPDAQNLARILGSQVGAGALRRGSIGLHGFVPATCPPCPDCSGPASDSPPPEASAMYQAVLEIPTLDCWDQTKIDGGFAFDFDTMWADYIEVGGFGVRPTGEILEIGPREVGYFLDGVTLPIGDFVELRFDDLDYPQTFTAVVVFSERNGIGGFERVLADAWATASDFISEKIGEAIASSGVISGPAAPIIGAIVSAAVEWILDEIAGAFMNLFEDTIFPPYMTNITVHDPANPTVGDVTVPLPVTLNGGGGTYSFLSHWRIEAA